MSGDISIHDPTDTTEIDPSGLKSFDEVEGALDDRPEANGRSFTVTQHDPFLILEATNVLNEEEKLSPTAGQILDSLGQTYAELGSMNIVRAFYRGKLPGGLHGGDTITLTFDEGTENFAFRFFDSGWTPVTGQHITGTPDDIQDIDHNALKTMLEEAGQLGE